MVAKPFYKVWYQTQKLYWAWLAKSKSIVKAYCGTVWTESNKHLRRVTFAFVLPLCNSAKKT